MPLLQVLAPLKAAAIDPSTRPTRSAPSSSAARSSPAWPTSLAGAISDRTRSRFGRRRPWLVAGLPGSLFGYWLIWQAKTPLALIARDRFFQLAFNFLFSALIAILPDQVPDLQKGKISAAAALGFPVGTLVGDALVGRLFHAEAARFLALGVIVTAALLPLILGLEDADSRRRSRP